MRIAIIMFGILLFPGVILTFAATKKQTIRISKTFSSKNFVISAPSIVAVIGALDAFMSLVVILCFTFLSQQLPHPIFYIVFGGFLWLGTYLLFKALTFKVFVKDNRITVCSGLKKPYSFLFSEINIAIRQIKNNRIKSERIVVKTITGKKLIIESTEISYFRFLDRISSEVSRDRLVGFEQ